MLGKYFQPPGYFMPQGPGMSPDKFPCFPMGQMGQMGPMGQLSQSQINQLNQMNQMNQMGQLPMGQLLQKPQFMMHPSQQAPPQPQPQNPSAPQQPVPSAQPIAHPAFFHEPFRRTAFNSIPTKQPISSECKIFRRASYHVAIAYNIHLMKVRTART